MARQRTFSRFRRGPFRVLFTSGAHMDFGVGSRVRFELDDQGSIIDYEIEGHEVVLIPHIDRIEAIVMLSKGP